MEGKNIAWDCQLTNAYLQCLWMQMATIGLIQFIGAKHSFEFIIYYLGVAEGKQYFVCAVLCSAGYL